VTSYETGVLVLGALLVGGALISGLATVTVNVPSDQTLGLNPGSPGSVLIQGVPPGTTNGVNFNGVFSVQSVPNANSFTFALNSSVNDNATGDSDSFAYFSTPNLVVGLSRLLFPIVALLGASGIIVGILNSYDEFSIPALAPVAWNLAIILGLVLGVPRADTTDAKLYVYAFSILIGTVIQVLLPLPWLRGRDDRLRLVIDWRDPAVAQTFKLMVPVTLGGVISLGSRTTRRSRPLDPSCTISAR